MHNQSKDKNNKKNKPTMDIINSLEQTQAGTHSIIVYPDLDTIREIYGSFVKGELERNQMVLILPFYETVDAVKNTLMEAGLDASYYLKEGSLLIVDAREAFFNHNNHMPREGERGSLVSLVRILNKQENKLQKNGTTIIADLGCFFPDAGAERLFFYESSIPHRLQNTRLKQICVYHQQDFDVRFNKKERSNLIDNHARSIIMVGNNHAR